ncbi:MAG: epoxyqueuosine reductase QueH, partial [Clostridia bacterium]|nr:epoxyqueuosine reductase QueH [Clostridia bacterium]
DSNKFLKAYDGLEGCKEGGERCKTCIYLRLKKTAIFAKENGFDVFASTLSVSPHKNAQLINEIGKELEKEFNIEYLISDFKKQDGYLNSIKLSKEYNLYRQKYCGCKYSIY